MTSKSKQISANFCPIELIRKYIHAEARAVCYLWSVSVGGNKRRVLPTVLHSTSNCQDLQLSRFSGFFFFDENNGMQKELRRRGWQMQDWSPLPSNCLVIGERFPLSHYLTCRRGRQMWLSGHQLSPGRMCCGTGRSFPARRPVICFTPVLIFPHDR